MSDTIITGSRAKDNETPAVKSVSRRGRSTTGNVYRAADTGGVIPDRWLQHLSARLSPAGRPCECVRLGVPRVQTQAVCLSVCDGDVIYRFFFAGSQADVYQLLPNL